MEQALILMHAKPLLPRKPWWLLLGTALTIVTAQAEAQTVQAAGKKNPETQISASPAPPKPGAADRKALPAGFSKTIPASIANLKAMEEHVKALVKRVSPAVVAVEVGDGSGSGVVITADGLIVTAGHVCGGPNRDVSFTFPDGKIAHGKTLGVDLESDTGLMKITEPGPWPHVATGELEQAKLGNWVLALGHPGGFDLKRSLVARLGRIIRLAPESLQTDCPISPGDSGGPLFDMYGRVIGIHSYISSSPADNFHVPITAYYDSWAMLVKSKPNVQ
jgi:serine protease Do